MEIWGADVRVRITGADGSWYERIMPMDEAMRMGSIRELSLYVDGARVLGVPLTPEVLHLLRRPRGWRDRWWRVERQIWRVRRRIRGRR